jgi:hypothetical protein
MFFHHSHQAVCRALFSCLLDHVSPVDNVHVRSPRTPAHMPSGGSHTRAHGFGSFGLDFKKCDKMLWEVGLSQYQETAKR